MQKKRSISDSARKNALAYYIFFSINAIASFVASPFLLGYLGAHGFGLWKAAQKILDFASIADGRSTQALKWIIANHESKVDYDYKRRMVGAALRVWMFFFPFLLLITSLIVFYLPDLIKGSSATDGSALLLVGVVLGLNIVLAPLVGVPDAVLIGVNQGYKSTLSQGLWLVLGTGAMVLAAYLGFGIVGVAIAFSGFALLNGVSVLLLAVRGVSWFGVNAPRRNEIKSFLNFSGWVLLWMVVERGLLSLEVILVGAYLGSETVTGYSFTSYLVQFGVGIALLTGSAITPGLGRVAGENDVTRLLHGINLFRELALFLIVLFGAGFVLFNEIFVTAWVGKSVYLGKYSDLLIALMLVQVIHIRSEAQIQDLRLNIKHRSLLGGAVTLLTVISVMAYDFFFVTTPISLLTIVFLTRLPLNFIIPRMVNCSNGLSAPRMKCFVAVLLVGVSCFFSSKYYLIESDLLKMLAALVLWFLSVGVAFIWILSKEIKFKVFESIGLRRCA